MRIDFPQGVPDGCIIWLREHVGMGMNVGKKPRKDNVTFDECAWFYERRFEVIPSTDPSMDSNGRYIPSITIKDGKSDQAIMFKLTWS